MPLMLKAEVNYLNNFQISRNRNFAVGNDTYELVLLLSNASTSKGFSFLGMSGNITYSRGVISRESIKVLVQEGIFKTLAF